MPCSKGMRDCKSNCLHRALVAAYREERRRQEVELEVETLGYDTEMNARRHELVTFYDWLVFSKIDIDSLVKHAI